MEERSYYVILGVSRTESAEGIRSAYRDLAKKHHPDVSGDEGTQVFQEISEAYRVLSDPHLRRRYDERLRHAEPSLARAVSSPPAGARAAPEPFYAEPVSILGVPETIRPSYEAMYDRFRRNFTGRGVPKAERLEPLEFDLVLTPEEAARGGILPVGVPAFVTCPDCGGSGHDWLFPCIRCGQQGVLELERVVRIGVRPMTPPGTVIEVPPEGLGIHNFFLRLHVFVES